MKLNRVQRFSFLMLFSLMLISTACNNKNSSSDINYINNNNNSKFSSDCDGGTPCKD